MNERMIELYKEATEFAYKVCKDERRTGGPSDHIWNTLSTGKFAELIVKECIAITDDLVNRNTDGTWTSTELYTDYNGALFEVKRRIEEHFGVAE